MAKTGIEIPEAPYPHDGNHEVASVAPDLGRAAMEPLSDADAARRDALLAQKAAFSKTKIGLANRSNSRTTPASHLH